MVRSQGVNLFILYFVVTYIIHYLKFLRVKWEGFCQCCIMSIQMLSFIQEMADLDVEEIMAKQVEQLEKEKKELQERLKGQEKKVNCGIVVNCCTIVNCGIITT